MIDRKVIALFTIDAKHNKNSKVLAGIFDSKETAIKTLKPILKTIAADEYSNLGYDYWNNLFDDLVSNLEEIDQTKSLSENYVMETILLNELF